MGAGERIIRPEQVPAIAAHQLVPQHIVHRLMIPCAYVPQAGEPIRRTIRAPVTAGRTVGALMAAVAASGAAVGVVVGATPVFAVQPSKVQAW